MSVVHSLFDGRQEDIEADVLFPDGSPEIPTTTGVLSTGSALVPILKSALADHYDRPEDEFDNYEVVLEPNGNITFRPKAIFGLINI